MATVVAIKAMTRQFLDETMRDPDLAAKSDDYRAGYEHGFREAVAAMIAPKLADRQR